MAGECGGGGDITSGDVSAGEHPSTLLGLFVGRPQPGVVLVTVTGELDIGTAPTLRRALERAVTPAVRHLVIDLGPVAFFGSAGVSELLLARQRAADGGFELHLCGVRDNRRVDRVLDLTGLLKHFTIHAGAGHALADIAQR